VDKQIAWKYWDELPKEIQDAFRYSGHGFSDEDIHTIFLAYKRGKLNVEQLVEQIQRMDRIRCAITQVNR